MAIHKRAKNIYITVHKKCTVTVGGKLETIADKINVEATKGNLVLSSNKKIVANGDKH